MKKITIIDYGCGNLYAIQHALREIGANFKISSDSDSISKFDKLLLISERLGVEIKLDNF